MLLTCEKCKTIFRIDNAAVAPNGQQVRCSVCAHIWHVEGLGKSAPPPRNAVWDVIQKLRLPTALLLFVMLISGTLFSFRAPLTATFPGLIPSFNGAGLTIEPNLDILKIQNLQATYQGNLLRVRGQIFNSDSFTAHAAPLLMQVVGEDNTLLASEKLVPEDAFIAAGQTTDFFIQKEVSDAHSAEIQVDLLPEPLMR